MGIVVYDVGGVIINLPTRMTLEEARKQQSAWHTVRPVAPLAQIKRVTQKFDSAYLISGVMNEELAKTTRDWLDFWKFWDETGIPPSRLIFCGMEYGAKAAVCRRLPQMPDCVVDDRPEVLAELDGLVATRVFFDRGEGELQPVGTIRVSSWDELERKVG